LQWRAGVGILRDIAARTHVELTNNVMICLDGNTVCGLANDGSHDLRLKGNTFVVYPYSGRDHACSLLTDLRFANPVSIDATGNLFSFPGGTWDGLPVLRVLTPGHVRWQGRANFSAGLSLDPVVAKKEDTGLAAWQKLATKEEEPREAEHVAFAWQLLQLPTQAAITKALGELMARQRGTEPGPDFARLGPGEAYVRALKVAPDQLRPPPVAGGAFVRMRNGQVVAGYPSLAEAAAVAESGEMIEIRGDGPFTSAEIAGKNRVLSLRAAPGYHPVLDGGLTWSGDTLTLEGLDVRRGGVRAIGASSTVMRLANCAIDGPVLSGLEPGTGRPRQVVNCLITGVVRTHLHANQQLRFENTVLPNIEIWFPPNSERASLELERCACWNATSAPVIGVTSRALDVTVRRTLVCSVGGLVPGPKSLTAWHGTRNVYLLGQRNWYASADPLLVLGLEEWRRAWKSDADSTAAEPPFFEPVQWRLLPTSPGARQAPGGADYGADVDRIAPAR
jgi:hypothetical protein